MADLSIPGVSNTYKTDELIQALVEEAKIPLNREKERLETYQTQESAWRNINSNMTKVENSAKELYSFENPFNSRITTSSEENAITIEADRSADLGTYKIDVKNVATADRFLSKEIQEDAEVPKGTYTFLVGEKKLSFNWKGGDIDNFVTSLNKRSTGLIKARLIGITKDSNSLLIESLIPGESNKLVFEDDALQFALDNEIIKPITTTSDTFTIQKNELQNTSTLSASSVSVSSEKITLPPQSGFEVAIPSSVQREINNQIEISFSLENIPQDEILDSEPVLPSAGTVNFKNITLNQSQVETELPETKEYIPPKIVEDYSSVFIKTQNGTEISLSDLPSDGKEKTFTISLSDYDSTPTSIIIKNNNTGKVLSMSQPKTINSNAAAGYEGVNPIALAGDAKIVYEGITMIRPENEIDDVIPNVTLHLQEPTKNTATLKIEPDAETIKNSLIEFVGNYNKLMAEINILTQNKPELISELDYLSDDEIDVATEQLGLFQSEFSLTSSKQSLSNIISNYYRTTDDAKFNMLSDIGISTNASSGYSGYSESQLRGYLEINEETLDNAIENNLENIKNIFGFDTDNDKIIDSGIGYLIYKNLHSYTMTGGIIAMKTISLDSQIKTSNTKIASLEEDVEDTEQSLKTKYGSMESTLNSLNTQASSIESFSNQNNNNN